MKSVIIFILFCCNFFSFYGQEKLHVNGFVYDKSTGEVLIGASIYEKTTNTGVTSNEYGYYSLTLPRIDSLELHVSFTGYKTIKMAISSNQNNDQIDFQLLQGVLFGEATIVASKEESIVEKTETGVVRLKMKEIKTLPNLFGEVDIIKAYQLTPGVQSGGEAKSNLYVRGGSPDQNLILLDDVPLYYVAHFGGFLSVFNADAINSVKLIKGGFPAQYGSRLSSVLDIKMKEGNMQYLHVEGAIGLLSSKILIEAPIVKNKVSFFVSARRNLLPIFKLFGTGLAYNFYDINAKINYRLSAKNKIFFSYYMGNDILSLREKTDISRHKTTIKWGNNLTAFRWNHIYTNKLFSNLTLSSTYYRYKNIFNYKIDTDSIDRNLNSSILTGINDLSLKIDFTYSNNSRYNIKFGGNSTYHTFIPNDEKFSQSGTAIVSIDKDYSNRTEALENAVYIENVLKFKRFNTNIGLRFSSYHTGNNNYHSLEPRVILNYMFNENLSFKYSFSKMTQYIHLLAYSGTGIPSDYWMPTNENVKPEKSIQNSFGIAKTFHNNKYELSLEAYNKTMDNLITFAPGESLLGNFDTWENVIEKNGEGQNYGVELFVQKKAGNTTGWLGATLAKAERKFENINQGESYSFKYDRLLDLSIVVNHKLKENIVISSTWTYGTGYPITLAIEHYTINGEDVFVYGNKNSFRMRDYHRLDVAANFNKKTKWGERTWSISIFNLYNRQNPYYYYYDREIVGSNLNNAGNGYSFSSEYGALKLYQKSLFSIFPTVSYSFKLVVPDNN